MEVKIDSRLPKGIIIIKKDENMKEIKFPIENITKTYTKVFCTEDNCKYNQKDRQDDRYCKRKKINLVVGFGEFSCVSYKPKERKEEKDTFEFEDTGQH